MGKIVTIQMPEVFMKMVHPFVFHVKNGFQNKMEKI